MNRVAYKAYLASREWAMLKEQVRKRSAGFCERCITAPYQETHHLTYERTGSERLEDLLAVCSPCHAYLSAKSNVDPCNVARRAVLIDLIYDGLRAAGVDITPLEEEPTPTPAPTQAPPEESLWTCACRWVNHRRDARCGACFKVRTPDAYRGPWTCTTCDYENEAIVKYYCQMCGGDRVTQVSSA